MIAQDEKHIDIYDGEINIKDTVDRKDVLIHFVCDYGSRYGNGVKFMPRKKILFVRVNGFKKLFQVDKKHCLDARVGPIGDTDRYRVIWG